MNCATCIGVLAYPNSPDYITDQTSIIRFQVSVVDILNGIEPGAPSHVLRETFTAIQGLAPVTPQRKRMTYLALTKMCMPNLAEVFVDGTVGAVLSAHAVPIKLKYECPPSSMSSVV